jgi:hypothetical protein
MKFILIVISIISGIKHLDIGYLKLNEGLLMIPAKFASILFSFFLSIMMSSIVSGIATYNAVGLGDSFFNFWMMAWLKSWLVAFPAILVIAPLTRKLVGKLTKNP